MLVAMISVTNVNNMNIPEFTLNCLIFIVRSPRHIHRKNTRGKKVWESIFLWSEGVQTTYERTTIRCVNCGRQRKVLQWRKGKRKG